MFTFVVRQVIPATPTARLIRLDLAGLPFRFRAGQAVLVGRCGQPVRRPYSIACAPEQAAARRELELLIRVDASGSAGPHLPALTPGDRLDVEGPVGSFVFPERPEERQFLFIGGGTGIAPLRAMVWHALLRRISGRLVMVYSARAPEELACREELQQLASEGRIELHLTVTRTAGGLWAGSRGRVDAARLDRIVTDTATRCFVCGPGSLVRDMPMILAGLGVSPSRIHLEVW